MNDLKNPSKNIEKTELDPQFLEHGIYIHEDDQDWGSAGMNDIGQASDLSK